MEQNTNILKYKSNELKSIQIENIVINAVVEQIKKDFPNCQSVKFNIDLINDICDAIEEVVKTNKLNVVKIDLFFKIYNTVFGNTTDEQKLFLRNVIDNLHKNGQIKVASRLYKFYKWLKSFFLKNI